MVKAVVTGAAGFVGRVLCESLRADGYDVAALLRTAQPGPWDSYAAVDLGRGRVDPESMRGAEVVFHLAARVHAVGAMHESKDDYVPANVTGTAEVLEASCRAGVPRVVFVSSVKAVGDVAGAPGNEDVALPAESPYGWSKRTAEEIVLADGHSTGRHVVVVRPTVVYGPGVKGNLARMLSGIDRGRFPLLSGPLNRRCMVSVTDLVRALRHVADDPAAALGTYIVTDGRTYSTRSIHESMAAALDRPLPRWSVPPTVLKGAGIVGDALELLTRQPMPLDSATLERLLGSAWYCSERIERELGFRPTQDLTTVLPQMVQAYRCGSVQQPLGTAPATNGA